MTQRSVLEPAAVPGQRAPLADSTVLMGANTYRLVSGFAADGEPGTDVLAGLNKLVFSTESRGGA